MLKNRLGLSKLAILSVLLLFGVALTIARVFAQNTIVLHNFTAQEGRSSLIGMIRAIDGNFYGTTASGGAFGCGSVYRTDQYGHFTTLYAFSSNGIDGCGPLAGLIEANDGNFYGTTDGGGTGGNNGSIFRIDRNGNFLSILSFDGTNGRQPSKLIQGADAFRLYDTFGFPIELTEEYAEEVGMTVDHEGFEASMEQIGRAHV